MRSQIEKAEAFRALQYAARRLYHSQSWDAGTTKLLAAMVSRALATTSLGLANTLGSATVSLDAIIENCRAIAQATDLPVNADLENCGADDPKTRQRRLHARPKPGVVGGSIEDVHRRSQSPIYEFARRVERVHAAVEAARALAVPVSTLTRAAPKSSVGPQRSRRHISGCRRFEAAGADVLYFARRA